jgi:hypothetical protein
MESIVYRTSLITATFSLSISVTLDFSTTLRLLGRETLSTTHSRSLVNSAFLKNYTRYIKTVDLISMGFSC